jgi:hypothetical protein
MKKTVIEAPILRHFDRNKTAYVEADSSNYISSRVLSQMDDEGILHLVAFFLKKLILAKCNYEIYSKELLAIICCFKAWRLELKGTNLPI